MDGGMSSALRLAREKSFHDNQACRRGESFASEPQRLQFSDDAYLDHETWIRPAVDRLGEIGGLDVLDYGCGHGMAAVVLARSGARVTGIDLSGKYIAEARQRAAANAVSINFLQADGEHLPFADHSFDRVWGNAVLHHLNIDQAGLELRRILRPGGVGVFCEPWGDNPFLNWARNYLKYDSKERTRDEKPLRNKTIAPFRTHFSLVDLEGHQLLSMVRRVCGMPALIRMLDRMDRLILGCSPSLQAYCRYMIVTVRP
jgi:SAM-dependent methyltransferase